VVRAEQTLPTHTWFTLFEGSSNPRVREARIAAGPPEAAVDSVVLDPLEPGRSGRVYRNGNLAFAWRVPLIGPGTYPVSVRMFFPMWSRATLGLPQSR
jgi:hypothetical protein